MEPNKLTIRELAPYLPYKLKVYDTFDEIIRELHSINTISDDSIGILGRVQHGRRIEEIKPLLFPLSSLTKEIEVNGERFMPAYKLFPVEDFELEVGMPNSIDYANSFIIQKGDMCLDYKTWERLFEWHFDVFSLIQRNLAIDKTLKP